MTEAGSARTQNCPVCGQAMERGFAIAQPAMQTLYWPATIGWLSPSDGPTGRGIRDQAFAQPLVQIGLRSWTPVPRFPAWRCTRCRRVEFTYGDAILKATPEQEPHREMESRRGSDFDAGRT